MFRFRVHTLQDRQICSCRRSQPYPIRDMTGNLFGSRKVAAHYSAAEVHLDPESGGGILPYQQRRHVVSSSCQIPLYESPTFHDIFSMNLVGLKNSKELVHTLTDLLADSYCPIAMIHRKSGPKIPTPASFTLSRIRCNFVSFTAGILTQTEVQQQRKMVRMHDESMSKVPRPLFGGTQPCVISCSGEVEFMI